MRILQLNSQTEKLLFLRRASRDEQAHSIAARIVANVRKRGDAALFSWTRKLDGTDLASKGVWITRAEMTAAKRQVSADFLRAIRTAAKNVRRVAERQLPQPWSLETMLGVHISQRVSPIESIGCYIPGGRFSLVSTLIMTCVPAQVAGVPRLVAVCPRPNAELLAAAHLLGVERIGRIGGAQAIAALAFGTKSVPRVEKLFGPGNKFVTAAKQIVSSDCAIDLPAGPTEAMVLAATGNARWIAADLLAQAEHAKDAASFLITTSSKLAREVQKEIESQLAAMPESLACLSTRDAGAILVADSLAQACSFVNRFAPEHLSLVGNAGALLEKIHSVGTIYLGDWGPQPLGDYATGSHHVLPTNGWARKRGGLSTADFVKCFTVQTISRVGFQRLAPVVETLAESEGLLAHRNAVRVRR